MVSLGICVVVACVLSVAGFRCFDYGSFWFWE